MRKNIMLAAGVVAGLAAFVGFVPAASAAPGIPTCLILNGGHGETFTKSVLCVELRNVVDGDVGDGRYLPGTSGPHWLSVTLEYQPIVSTDHVPPDWAPIAASTVDGTGKLEITTRMVRMHFPGRLRACAHAGAPDSVVVQQVCASD
jgi:hypothetical protein